MGIFLNLEENLNIIHEDVIHRGEDGTKMTICSHSTAGRNGYYFKVYNGADIMSSKKVARINLEKPEYEYHRDEYGKRIWVMSDNEIRKMIEILNSKSTWKKTLGGTVWQDVVWQCLKYEKSYTSSTMPDLPMPDYTKLVFDGSRGNKFK